MRYIKEQLGLHDIELGLRDIGVWGEIVQTGDGIELRLSIKGSASGDHEELIHGEVDKIADLVSLTARQIMQTLNPYILASYEMATERRRCNTSPPCNYAKPTKMFQDLTDIGTMDDRKWALMGLAAIHVQQRAYAALIRDCSRAIAVDPKFALAFYNWGNALAMLNKNEEAIEKWQKAVELDPKFASTHMNWGLALQSLGKKDEAMEKFRQGCRARSEGSSHVYRFGPCACRVRQKRRSFRKISQGHRA